MRLLYWNANLTASRSSSEPVINTKDGLRNKFYIPMLSVKQVSFKHTQKFIKTLGMTECPTALLSDFLTDGRTDRRTGCLTGCLTA